MLDALQLRFNASRVVELKQSLFLLPMVDELYDALPNADSATEINGDFHFKFLSPKLIATLTEASKEESVAYVETEYFGGLGDQGAIVAKEGRIAFGPTDGDGSINSALRLIGVKKGLARDEFDAVGLDKFRSNEDWLDQPSN